MAKCYILPLFVKNTIVQPIGYRLLYNELIYRYYTVCKNGQTSISKLVMVVQKTLPKLGASTLPLYSIINE